jgi:hypothetical protein
MPSGGRRVTKKFREGKMSDPRFDEKGREKNEEKTEEKSWEEKWQSDPLNSVIWASIFIWAGIVFLLSNLGYLDSLLRETFNLTGISYLDNVIQAWPLVLVGAGVILLIGVLIRLLVPAYRKPILGQVILALVFIGIGLGDLVNWGFIWAVILIIAGIAIITRGIRRPKNTEDK